jgi:hypothetical protein
MVEYRIIVTYKDGHIDEYGSKYIDIIKARYLLLKDDMNHDDTIMNITRLSGNRVMEQLIRSRINMEE